MKKYANKELIVFDLDGTLAESKSNLRPDMARALRALLAKKKVAVIGGGTYEQFSKQLVKELTCPPELLQNLFLFPTTSTSFYRYNRGWKKVYRRVLSAIERKKIKNALQISFKTNNYIPSKKLWGKLIEDRGTQITFSALGQKAPVAAKEAWNATQDVRPQLMKTLVKLLPKFEVRRGGLTSIDITEKGIDKAYGIRQIKKVLKIQIKNMVFIGDALYPGGNDYAAKKTGIDCIAIKGPKDTKRIIEQIIAE
jgi:HAD superfamily hydrolase (TIGR01484 family)